jgi:hypothetical protein
MNSHFRSNTHVNKSGTLPLEALVPEAIEPLLLEECVRLVEFFADHEEAFVRGPDALSSEALLDERAGEILVILDELPILHVFDAVEAESVDMEVSHPAH